MSVELVPIVPNLVSSITGFQNKYGNDSQYVPQLLAPLNALPSTLASGRAASTANTLLPLQRYDAQRALRGQSPLTARQSALALRTLASGKPATPPRRQSLLQSALSDLRNLVGSIPKLPMAAYQEAKSLPEVPGQISDVLGEGDNPLTTLGNLATVNGLRMIPGSFVASTLLADEERGGGQGLEGLRAHPLFTALDALPAAQGAARLTPAARAAKEQVATLNAARVADRVAEGYAPGTTTLLPEPRALQTALTRRVDPTTGAVVPNILGRGIQSAVDDFYSTSPGRAFQGAFKERDTSRIMERGGAFLRESVDPRVPSDLLRPNVPGGAGAMQSELAIRDAAAKLQLDMRDVGLDTPEMYDLITNPRLADGTPTTPELHPDLTPEQRVVARELRDFETMTGGYTSQLGREGTGVVSIDGVDEVFDYARARRLTKAQTAAARAQEVLDARELVLNPSTITSPRSVLDLIDDVDRRRASGSITKSEAATLERTYRAALDEAGWVEDVAAGTWSKVNRPTIQDVVDALKPYRTRPVVTRLIDNLTNARWSAAGRDLANLDRSTVHVLPIDLPGFRAEVSRLVTRDRTLSRTSAYTPRLIQRLQKQTARIESTSAPARFSDAVNETAKEAIKARANTVFSTSPDLDSLIAQIDEGIYDNLTAADPRFAKWVRQDQAAARATWKELRDAGLDPIFVSRVTPAQARRQGFARLSDRPTTIQSTKARMMDASPVVKDLTIAVNQQALDIIQRRATQAALDEIGTYGRTRGDLVAELTPLAESRFARNPDIPMRVHLDNLISQRWVRYNPGEFGGKPGSTFAVEGASDTYIPRVMQENLQRMFTPPLPKLTAAFDPVMRVFRTSVLPLALRWQLNNLISGAIIMAINDPRAFLELPAVVRGLRAEKRAMRGEASTVSTAANRAHIEGAPPAGIGNMPDEMRSWDAKVTRESPLRDRIAASHNYAMGRSMGTWMEQARAGRIKTIKSGARRALEASYDANQFVDDVVRGSLGARAYKKAIKGGASDDLAQAMTTSTIRRVFQAWDEMTPIERSVMRTVIPFYGFAAYATKYALRYPFDHPFRASVLNSIATNELVDGMTGLPEYLREMIFLGDPRANTNTRALNISPMNPFGGVPSMFTVAGLLGQTNPVITGVLESVGVNVQQGGPMLYPEMRYDPETGRLVADPSGNLASNIVGNITPQVQGILSMLGKNEGFNELLARDPGAAGRQLLSNFGVPILFRNIDTGEQLIRSEMARFEDQETVRREALSTGNLSMLGDFPGLAAYGDQIRALEAAGQLDQLRPGTYAPDAATAPGRAYAAQVAAMGSPN